MNTMKTFLLIGLGRLGKHIASRLNTLGHEVMAVDKHEDRINDVLPIVTTAQIGDSTNPQFLKSLGVDNYDVCIVTISNDFQSSLETTSLLKEMGARFVVSRANRDVHAKFLLRNGADEIIYPERQSAQWAAIRYSSEHIMDYFDLEDGQAVFEVTVPEDWIGYTIAQIDVRKKYNVNIIAIKQDGKFVMSMTPDSILTEGQTLLVFGDYKALQKCFKK